LAIWILFGVACTQEDQTPPATPTTESKEGWFREGISPPFVHRTGANGAYLLPESVSGGAGLADLDGDGWLDLVLVQSTAGPSAIFLNRGDGTFGGEPISLPQPRGFFGMGVAIGDYDSDGDPDVYLTGLGPNRLFENRGQGRFEERAEEAGVADRGFGASAIFLDFDRDGDLDLFVVRYTDWSPGIEIRCSDAADRPDYCNPANYERPSSDLLYRNVGNGEFLNVTEELGLDAARGNGLGVVADDFDGDGWVDLFVSNDTDPDRLWLNQSGEGFVERGLASGCAVDDSGLAKAGMGIGIADLDGNGESDLLVVNLHGESDSLFMNHGGTFRDETARRGLGTTSRPYTRFGVGIHDFDLDGHLDIYLANGRIKRLEPKYADDPYAEPDLLLRGTANGRFEPVPIALSGPPTTSRAAAFGDLNNDGTVDIVVIARDETPTVLYNTSRELGRGLVLAGLPAETSEVHLEIEHENGRKEQIARRSRVAYGYLATHDPRPHFGIPNGATALRLVIEYDDATSESFPIDQAASAQTTGVVQLENLRSDR